jgi:hypothetical protein
MTIQHFSARQFKVEDLVVVDLARGGAQEQRGVGGGGRARGALGTRRVRVTALLRVSLRIWLDCRNTRGKSWALL